MKLGHKLLLARPCQQILRSRNLSTTSECLMPKDEAKAEEHAPSDVKDGKTKSEKQKKTMQQIDEELRAAMEGHAGDGGLAGAELENGKAVSMKRGVRDNMFRYI